MSDKSDYILPEVSRHYWSIGNLGSKFRLPLVGDWTDPNDHSVHHFVITYDDEKKQELVLWEAIYIDGDLRYEAIAIKSITNDQHLRYKARDFALWVFSSAKPEVLPGIAFL